MVNQKIIFGIRLKSIIAVTFLVIYVSVILGFFFTKQINRIVHTNLKQIGMVLASNLAYNAEYGVLTDNAEVLRNLVDGVMKQSQVEYCLIQDLEGNILSARGLEKKLKGLDQDFSIQSIDINAPIVDLVKGCNSLEFYEIIAPVVSKQIDAPKDESSIFSEEMIVDSKNQKAIETKIGIVRVGLSLVDVYEFERKSQQTTIAITLLIILIAGFMTTIVTGIAVKPINKLVDGMKKVASGNLKVSIDSKGSDEIAYLTNSFNLMTGDIRKSHDEIIHAKDFTDNILKSMVEILVVVDRHGKIVRINPAAAKLLEYSEEEILGQPINIIFSDQPNETQREFQSKVAEELARVGFVTDYEMNYKTKMGSVIPIVFSASMMRDKNGKVEGVVGIARDLTERKVAESLIELKNRMLEKVNADLLANEIKLNNIVADLKEVNEELTQTQSQLIQSEKLASLGQLSAGIAHEINNPLGFVGSNLAVMEQYIKSITELISKFELIKLAVEKKDLHQVISAQKNISDFEEKSNMKMILSDLNNLLSESLNGVERISLIVKDLKSFARQDIQTKGMVDLNKIFEGVLHIAWSEIKYKAELKQELGQIPLVECNAHQIGQVFINLLINASQAIKDHGIITVKTYFEKGRVFVKVSDTGVGIPRSIMDKIFDPFFTTKEIGKGTGLGLSISYELVKNNGGEIFVESQQGKGTSFILSFPTKPE